MSAGIQLFPNLPQDGNPISIPGFAAGLRAMAFALENMSVANGHVDWYGGAPVIYLDGPKADLDVLGEPGLFKAVTLVGWTLSEGEWTQMSYEDMIDDPPTELWTGANADGNYLRPTWDYIRAVPEDDEEEPEE